MGLAFLFIMVFNEQKTRQIAVRRCTICGIDIIRNTRSGEKRIPTTQYIKAKFCSRRCKGIAHSELMKGKNNPKWNNGISTENTIVRGSTKYKKWRLSVFKRDNFTCVFCGKRGGELNADHIQAFATFPELRFSLDNGRTLCVPCHKTTDTYKVKNINK